LLSYKPRNSPEKYTPSLLPYKPWKSPEKNIYPSLWPNKAMNLYIISYFFFLLLTCLKTVFIDRCLSFFFWSKYFLLLIIHLVSSNVYVFVCIVTQSDTMREWLLNLCAKFKSDVRLYYNIFYRGFVIHLCFLYSLTCTCV
jgi:hypothetical protein